MEKAFHSENPSSAVAVVSAAVVEVFQQSTDV